MPSRLIPRFRTNRVNAPSVTLARPDLNDDTALVFRHYISHSMPTRLLSIDDSEPGKVRFQLMKREDLQAADYLTEEEIDSHLAESSSPDRSQAIRELLSERLKYAIFSHRWGESEATFEMVQNAGMAGLGADAPQGYKKLKKFCAMAVKNKCRLAWADTACIDKSKSAELEQAIRSMFNWYRNSAVCIIYLTNSSGMVDFENDPWFRRGWTLQELLAPAKIKFYTQNWTPIKSISESPNDKRDEAILRAISRATCIKESDLRYFSPGLFGVREKMVWASKRQTTLEEDIAYSLLGIFDISMPIAYGEGKRAFRRLMEVIVQDCREWQIFAWAGHHSPHAIAFPESPCGYGSQFLGQVEDSVLDPERPIHRPWDHGYPFYSMTKKGLEVKVLLVEMMLQVDRESVSEASLAYERLALHPTLQDQRYFHNVVAICDTRFLSYSRWAVGIISYQTDGNGEQDKKGELEANKGYVCFLLGTGIYSPYGKWEKVGTRKVLTVRTKDIVRRDLKTLWL